MSYYNSQAKHEKIRREHEQSRRRELKQQLKRDRKLSRKNPKT